MSTIPETKRLPETFGIRFGILNAKIGKQIKEQGLKYNGDEVSRFENLRDAIHSLSFGGLLVDSQIDKLWLKLYNKILRHVGKENGCNVKPLKIK